MSPRTKGEPRRESPFRSDEPSSDDGLDRDRYAKAFARLATECETPMVVGLYGTWGIGKSSLMLRIKEKLDEDGVPTVSFDPWRHQFEEDPIVALLHAMTVDLKLEARQDVKDLLTTVSLALGSAIVKATTGVSFGDLTKMSDAVAEEGFRVRSHQIRLRETIEKLIKKARGRKKRVVFFLDDLDRCLPKTMLRVLEALKLYLNVEDCVYFLGLDHTVVKKGIEKEYAELAIEDRDYLDKIVQIPFLIPPIHADRAREFIEGLLPGDAKQWAEKLVPFVGSNPRQVKRFTNNLAFNLLLASELFEDEEHDLDVNVVVVLVLIQHENEALAGQISRNWRLFPELMAKGEEAERLLQDYFGGDKRLQELVQALDCPDDTPYETYIYLTNVAGAAVRREERAAFEPEMASLDSGSYRMGSGEGDDDEKPVRDVTIGYRFAMGRYPVTFEEYDHFAEAMARKKPDDAGWGRGRRPVINVSWDDAKAYAVWLAGETGTGYRLPTEAEWEYACRAGTETAYSCGDEIGEKDANFGKSKDKTTEVGSYPANPWRLFDMHGNVWEWVEDVWHDSYEGAPADGSAWTEGGNPDRRVYRGGSWVSTPRFTRAAFRIGLSTGHRGSRTGFRLARTLP